MLINKKDISNVISTIVLTLALILIPMLIVPGDDYNFLKNVVLISSGVLLLFVFVPNVIKIKFDIKDYLLIIFLILAIISTILSVDIITSLKGANGRYEGILALLDGMESILPARYEIRT